MTAVDVFAVPILLVTASLVCLGMHIGHVHRTAKRGVADALQAMQLPVGQHAVVFCIAYQHPHYKEIEQLLVNMKTRAIVCLQAPDWFVALRAKTYTNHLVVRVAKAPRFTFLYQLAGTNVKPVWFPFRLLYKVSGAEVR